MGTGLGVQGTVLALQECTSMQQFSGMGSTIMSQVSEEQDDSEGKTDLLYL